MSFCKVRIFDWHYIRLWWRFRKILWPSQNIWTLTQKFLLFMRKISILLSHYFHGLPSLKLHIRTNIYCCYSSIVHNAWSWSFTLSFLHFHLNCFNFRRYLAYKYAISFFLSRLPNKVKQRKLIIEQLSQWASKYLRKFLGHDNNNFWPSYLTRDVAASRNPRIKL